MSEFAQSDLEEAVVNAALKQLKEGEDEHKVRVRRYDHSYDVYRASGPRDRSAKQWRSNLRVKYGMQTIDTALVNMVSGMPRAKVRPRQPGFELNAKAMQYALDYYVSEDHMVEKRPGFVQQGLIFGVTGAKNHWLFNERKMRQRRAAPNPFNAGQPYMLESEDTVTVDDRPTFEPWDVYDMWWDPDGRDVDSCDYVVLRSWVTKDWMLRNAHNPETGEGAYHNVDELLRGGGRRVDETAQSRHLGLQDRRGRIELLEVWRDDRLTVIGNRKVLLRDEPNPYWHGKKPVVIAQTRPDLFKMQGIPETDLVEDIQEALWTVQNMRMDNLHLTVMRGVTYREGGVYNVNDLELKPLFRWPVQDHDDVRPFEVQPLPREAYEEQQRLLADMQLVTGINPYISGSDLQSVDQNTATGVTALQDVASRLLRFKTQQIHFKGYQRTFEQWSEMTKQFLSDEMEVRVEGKGNEFSWVKFGPQDVIGSYDIVLEGSEESLSRQQERSEALGLLSSFAPLAQLGIINWQPILEKVAAAYDFPNPEALFKPPQQQQAYPVPPGQQQGPAALNGGNQAGSAIDPGALQAIMAGR